MWLRQMMLPGSDKTSMNVQPVIRIALAQGLLTAVIVLGAVAAGSVTGTGLIWAYSALAGGLTCLLPGLYSGIRLHAGQRVVQSSDGSDGQDASIVARRAVVQLLTAEAGKWALTVVLMLLTFRFVEPLCVWCYFGALLAGYCMYLVVPLRMYQRRRA